MTDVQKNPIFKLKAFATRFRHDDSGLALVEFAVSLPFFMGVAVAGVETANYAATTMRVNQIAMHVADNAARMGEDSPLPGQASKISEIEINDVFTGAKHEGRGLVLEGFHPYTDPGTNQEIARGNARIFLSSIEPKNNPNPQNKYKISWQRCSGPGTHYQPVYSKKSGNQDVDGVGPPGQKAIAPPNGATMFAEIHYHFQPLFDIGLSKLVQKDIIATASMVVRDSRDFSQVYNPENVTPSESNC